MPIVPARVFSPQTGNYITTYALLDTGSNSTYFTAELCQQLEVSGKERHIELTTLTNSKMPLRTTVVTIHVSSLDADKVYKVDATVRLDLNIYTAGLTTGLDLSKWPHLSDLIIPELGRHQPVLLLLGQDASDLLIPQEVRKGRAGDLFTMLTPLGWAINGPVDPKGQSKHNSYYVQKQDSLETDIIEDFGNRRCQ